jgi:adenylosuccinate synthase
VPNVDVIVGAYFGDEGKGKLVGATGHGYDAVLRVNASTNATHKVCDGEHTWITRQLPSVFFPRATRLVLAPGALLNLPALAEELAARPDLDTLAGNLAVASSIALVLPPYIEKGQGGMSLVIGSTRQGTGPSAVARTARHALHLHDVEAVVAGAAGAREEALEKLARTVRETWPERPAPPSPAYLDELLDEQVAAFRAVAALVGRFSVDYTRLLATRLSAARALLIEGCNGLLLDNLHGAHPHVTSTSTNVAAMLMGANLSPFWLRQAIVVTSAYANCLGKRPFPTEQSGAVAEHLHARCDERDVAAGELRRVGWLDVPGLRKALAGCAGAVLHLSKLDALSGLSELCVCTHLDVDGKLVEVLPDDPRAVRRARPVYLTLPGWSEPLGEARRFADLPAAARGYVLAVERLLGHRVVSLGVGPRNQDLIAVGAAAGLT